MALAYQQYEKDRMATARMVDQGISTKDSIEICSAIRGKQVGRALELLRLVVKKQRPIRYNRFNQESAGHRPGMGPGRFPIKAAQIFITLLESVQANATHKDLDSELLRIVHVKADKAARPYRFGRHRGRKFKRTHLEIVVAEDEALKERAKPKKAAAKSEAKPAAKKAAAEKPAKQETKAAETPAAKEPEAKAEKPAVEEKPKESEKKESKPKDEKPKAAASDSESKQESKDDKPAKKSEEGAQ